jgi:hypothetical protein
MDRAWKIQRQENQCFTVSDIAATQENLDFFFAAICQTLFQVCQVIVNIGDDSYDHYFKNFLQGFI